MKKLQTRLQALRNRKGFLSLETIIIVGVIVVLVVVCMTAFSRNASNLNEDYNNNVETAQTQQESLNNAMSTQQGTIQTGVLFS